MLGNESKKTICRFIEEQPSIVELLDSIYKKNIKGKVILNFDGQGNILPELNVNAGNLYTLMKINVEVLKKNK